jgi:transcriptional regulator with XRE-family HTH domain
VSDQTTEPADPVDPAGLFLRTLGKRIRLARLVRELTQAELADAAGLSRNFLSLIEHGAHGVDVVRLFRLAAALDMPLVDLVDDRSDPR